MRYKSLKLALLTCALVITCGHVGEAQQPLQQIAAQNSSDSQTPDALVRAFYESVSVKAGERHDWGRFRALFAPGARIVAVSKDESGRRAMRAQSVEEYIASATTPVPPRRGFEERELSRRDQRYGDIVQAWSAYERRFARGRVTGVNSIQMAFADGRWWVVNLLWTNDRSAGPLPAELLKPTAGEEAGR